MIKNFNYGGRSYFYDELASFEIEMGRYENEYTPTMKFNNHDDAITYYDSIKVEGGVKKRLVLISKDNRQIIARELSKRKVTL